MRSTYVLLVCLVSSSFFAPNHADAVGNTDLAPGVVNAETWISNIINNVGTSCSAGPPAVGIDATANIQNALTAVGNAGGGIVFLPTGFYCLYGHLTVPANTTLKGVFIGPPTQNFPTHVPTGGTVLLATEYAGNVSGTPFISLAGNSSAVDGLTIYYPNQTPPSPSAPSWTPTAYPPAIQAALPDAVIQNMMLLNPYWAINLTGQNGRHYVHGIYGEPLSQGISVDLSSDVGRISDIHFWPFWYGVDPLHSNQDLRVEQWIGNQAFSFVFGDADWEVVQDIFSLGYHVGILFSPTSNGSINGEFTNVNFDGVGVGIVAAGTQPYGVSITNLNMAASSLQGVSNPVAISNSGSNASTLRIVNASFWGSFSQIIYWGQNANGLLSLSHSQILFTSPTGLPAIEIAGSTSRAMIQDNTFEKSTTPFQAVKVDTGTGKVIITGNLLNSNTVPSTAGQVLSANNL